MPFDGGCNTPAIVDRMGGPRCLSGYTSLVDIDNIDERVRNCFGNYVFAIFVIYIFDLLFCPFSLQFAAFWRRKLPTQGIATFWSLNLSFFMVFASCGAQTSHVGWYFDLFCDLGLARVCLGLFEGFI